MELPSQLRTAAAREPAASAGRARGNGEERTRQEEVPPVPSGDTQSHRPAQGPLPANDSSHQDQRSDLGNKKDSKAPGIDEELHSCSQKASWGKKKKWVCFHVFFTPNLKFCTFCKIFKQIYLFINLTISHKIVLCLYTWQDVCLYMMDLGQNQGYKNPKFSRNLNTCDAVICSSPLCLFLEGILWRPIWFVVTIPKYIIIPENYSILFLYPPDDKVWTLFPWSWMHALGTEISQHVKIVAWSCSELFWTAERRTPFY